MPAGTPKQTDAVAVRQFVEDMATAFTAWGFPRMPARVLMALMATPESSLTAAEIGDALRISPAAVSGAVRYLQHVGVIQRVGAPGSRRDRYLLPDDAWYTASMTKSDALVRFAATADDGVRALGGPDTTAGSRVAEMREFFRFVAAEMDGLLDRWHAHRALQAGAGDL